jgi:hypothetical protein
VASAILTYLSIMGHKTADDIVTIATALSPLHLLYGRAIDRFDHFIISQLIVQHEIASHLTTFLNSPNPHRAHGAL